MTYESSAFIFFVALSAFAFYLLPASWFRWKFFTMNILWHASWSWQWTGIHFLICVVNYWLLKSSLPRKLYIALTFDVLAFVLLRMLIETQHIPLYGLSFAILGLLSLFLLQIRSQSAKPVVHVLDLYNNVTFFPALMAGPIHVFKSQSADYFTRTNSVNVKSIISGALIFIVGLFKYLLLVFWIRELRNLLEFADYAAINAVIYGLITTLGIYVHLAMLSDCGRGAAAVFGVTLSYNFRSLLFAANPLNLWDRWNISVSHWIRDFVSFPLMLQFGRKVNKYLIVMVSFVLIGLWHGFDWSWLAFGVGNGLAVVLYSYIQTKFSTFKHAQAILGGVLLICVLSFNGLITSSYRAYKLFSPDRFLLWSPFAPIGTFPYLLLAVLLTFYFLIEYKQEKEKNLDFYLRWPFPVQVGIVAVAVIAYIFTVELWSDDEFLPPFLYFLM